MAAAAAATAPLSAGEPAPRAVVELFTSQGCSSCPPADALFNKLSDDRSIVTLTFPVDYWDYLGWKDTFAKPEYSARQRAYAAMRGDRAVYTPQAVINGREHVVGSDADAIDHSIITQSSQGGLQVPIGVDFSGDLMIANVGAAAPGGDAKATVWLVKYSVVETVSIGRGENSGRNVKYAHVVREITPVGMWHGQPVRLEIPRSAVAGGKDLGYVLLLQSGKNGRFGPILGASVIEQADAS